MDAYEVIAPVYDLWQTRYGIFSDAVLETLAPWIDGLPVRGTMVDLGCGTGHLLSALAARRPDLRLLGVDASAAMLAQAQAKPGAAGIGWVRGELGQKIAGGPFDFVGCFFNTLNHLTDGEALRRTFATVADVLRPGARLAFDVNNATGFACWWQGERTYDGPGWQLGMRAAWDPVTARATVRIHVCHNGRHAEAELEEHFFSDDQIAAALGHCGLHIEHRQDWQPSPHQPPGATLWVARRPTDL